LKLSEVGLEVLGRARRFVVTKENTTLVDGAGARSDVDARVAQLKIEIENSDSDWDREKLQERLAKLSGGVAVINAASIARMVLTTESTIVDKPAEAQPAAAGGHGHGH
jgi:chaperonin GroEL